MPPCAHTNRVGNTICSYIACCAMAAGPLSEGASVVRRARVQSWGLEPKRHKSDSDGFLFVQGDFRPTRSRARPRQGMGFSLESRFSGATARHPHSSARDRRTERGTPVRSTPAFRVCRSRHARARETSARGGEQSVISRVASAGEATAWCATASCSSTSTWRRTSSWSRGTSGRTCRRCCGRSSRTRCVRGSIGWVGRDARSTNPKKMRGARNETGVRIGSAAATLARARAHRRLRKSASLH